MEHLPDTAKNRIFTFREDCKSNINEYRKKYENITFGDCFGRSSIQLIKKYGLLEAHLKHCNEVAKRLEQEEKIAKDKMLKEIHTLNNAELSTYLLQLYNALDVTSQNEALDAIKSLNECAEWCQSYR